MVFFSMFKSLSRPALIFFCALLFLSNLSCRTASSNTVASGRLDTLSPRKMLWAWEREEDLRFIDSKQYGVAFLAQTITLSGEDLRLNRRRQPLEVAPDTYLMAGTRIEADKPSI